MEFLADQKNVLNALQNVLRAIPSSTTIGVLKCILIDAKKKEDVTFFGCDLNFGVRTILRADVTKNGSVCVDAKMLLSIIKEFPSVSAIKFEKGGKSLTISSEKSQFNLPYISEKEFPAFPEITETDNLVMVKKHEIIAMFCSFGKASVCIPQKDNELARAPAAVFVKSNNDSIEFVGTDGNRMSFVIRSNLESLNGKINCLLPKVFIDNVSRVFSGNELEASDDSKIFVKTTEDLFCVCTNNVLCYCKVLAKKFPEYTDVVNSDYEKILTLKKNDLISSLKRVSVVSNQRDPYVILSVFPGTLTLSAESSELGSASDEIEIEYSGNPFEIGFNPKLLLEILGVISEETVTFGFQDAESPAMIKENNQTKFIIMPVRL